MKVYIVGIGMDGENTLTCHALSVIRSADVLIGSERTLKPFASLGKTTIAEYRSREIADFLHTVNYETAAVLMSGDCGFFSGAKSLLPLLKDLETEVICGISTPVYLCSKLNIPWEELHLVSLHGRESCIVRKVRAHRMVFFLMGGDITPGMLCRRLCDYGMNDITVHIGGSHSYPEERIISGTAEELTDCDISGLCAVITENPCFENRRRYGISDDEFIRGNIPMTKSVIRAAALSGLDIRRNDICWDIGCGTGSVSVEMAMQCEDGKVFAVDKAAEALELTNKNRIRFGCDNIDIIGGDAVEAVQSLPAPDCIFAGGSGGKLREILRAAEEKNPNVRAVVTAVSLETLMLCDDVFRELGREPDIMQIAVTKMQQKGSHRLMQSENPIFIIKRKII